MKIITDTILFELEEASGRESWRENWKHRTGEHNAYLLTIKMSPPHLMLIKQQTLSI